MDVFERLVELLVILIAAKVGAEVVARFRQPAVIEGDKGSRGCGVRSR